MLVSINNTIREVIVNVDPCNKDICYGRVDKIKFCWRRGFNLPFVIVDSVRDAYKTKIEITPFLRKYKEINRL